MRAIAYLHSTKEQMYDIGLRLGLSDDALKLFQFALYEVKFELEVDPETGNARIISVNDHVLEKW